MVRWFYVRVCAHADCVRLFATLWTVAHQAPQARILEWVAISFSKGSSRFWDRTRVLHLLHRQVGSLQLCRLGLFYVTKI